MEHQALSIRPFLGAKNFDLSRAFYSDFGFQELILGPKMSLFKSDKIGFYLQDAFIKDWIDNTMVFLEVQDVEAYWEYLVTLDLKRKYVNVKLIPVRIESWGKECFLHDPSGILWHFGEFFHK